MLIFDNPDLHVYMVYSHDGLMKRDMKEYQSLLIYMENFDKKAMSRLHYQVGIQGLNLKKH